MQARPMPTRPMPADHAGPMLADVRLRPYAGLVDLPDLLRIRNAAAAANRIPEVQTLALLELEMRPSPHCDPALDVVVAEVGGQPVGWGRIAWIDTNDGLREYRSGCDVDPDWRRRGIGLVLLETNQHRIREVAAGHDTTRPKVLGGWAAEHNPGAHALLGGAGFEPVRWFFIMRRQLAEPIPDLPLPPGLAVRPVSREDARRLFAADAEAFRDHWGGIDESEAAFERWVESPAFDTGLYVVAFDRDEVAGAVFNAVYREENEALGSRRGWLDGVFVRRPWRRRGLARALVARSLRLLREAGLDEGWLRVDADNPNGALGLYQDIGFVADQRFTAFRKPFEEG